MVFSLSARQEAIRKRVFGVEQGKNNSRLFSQLIRHTEAVAKDSGIDLVWIDESKQQGQSFGERYANAFQGLFEQGYDRVISIGSDCPDLSVGILKQALNSLADNQLVLGPVLDGGVYLIGIGKAAFSYDRFRALPWNSSQLLGGLRHYAGQRLQVICLKILADIDDYQSVLTYLNSFSGTFFSRLLICLLLPDVGYQPEAHLVMASQAIAADHRLRAPPCRYIQ